jgi:hypothetical protein
VSGKFHLCPKRPVYRRSWRLVWIRRINQEDSKTLRNAKHLTRMLEGHWRAAL